jgi:hypothetical protein
MFPVLDLDPVLRSTGAIRSIAMLRNKSLKPHPARGPKKTGKRHDEVDRLSRLLASAESQEDHHADNHRGANERNRT